MPQDEAKAPSPSPLFHQPLSWCHRVSRLPFQRVQTFSLLCGSPLKTIRRLTGDNSPPRCRRWTNQLRMITFDFSNLSPLSANPTFTHLWTWTMSKPKSLAFVILISPAWLQHFSQGAKYPPGGHIRLPAQRTVTRSTKLHANPQRSMDGNSIQK